MKLRDLIRSVRACKTAAEERAVISKECALIRTAIKEEDETFRHRNVAKLMYIHMLGYPTHFGQMECLKLISATTFPEKRVGYLALTLLLTENTEVLTLVTNSLKLDLTNSNQYIQALSLITIGNLATQDMARDLSSDVEKILRGSNSYLRKKAALATIRLFKKEPDLIEHMQERITLLLKDRAHGVIITGLQAMLDVLELAPEYKEEYSKLVPSLVRLLRNFISMGYSPEHDVFGITDPFNQVKLLTLLRKLGKGDAEASEHMNDVLAQVATNTDTSKNAGNAILYECVQTIMEIDSDQSLRVLAINILGRFLLNRDNNIRYVALNSLSKVVSEDIGAVQRQRNTIIDCLKDPDVSIRQRALELIYQLVNDQNVVMLTAELLNYLVVAASEHKGDLISKIMSTVEKYSPNQKWRIDTVITMLSIAGNFCDESVIRIAIILISQHADLHAYAVHRLYKNLIEDLSQFGLLQIGIWCIGEYGAMLTTFLPALDSETPAFDAVRGSDIVDLLERSLRLHNADTNLKCLVLSSLFKLSSRLSAETKGYITDVVATYQNSMSLELQQRSSEFSLLLTSRWDSIRPELVAKMPILDEEAMRKRRGEYDDATQDQSGPSIKAPTSVPSGLSFTSSAKAGSSLLDLDDIFGSSSTPSSVPGGMAFGGNSISTTKASGTAPVSNPVGTVDLLSDIFSLGPSIGQALPVTSTMPTMPSQQQVMPTNAFLSPALLSSVNPSIIAFDKGGFSVSMELSKPIPSNPATTKILCKFTNKASSEITDLNFQVRNSYFIYMYIL
jgi:AP-1 complex subunit gamma-1